MSSSSDVAYADLPRDEQRAIAASELRGAAWRGRSSASAVLLALSWRMDRLEAQHINPYTVPGLLPGLLGLVTILLGGLLALRSWRRGGRFVRGPQFALSGESARRLALVIGLIVAYTVVLLGRGLPFWLGAAIYVAGVDRAAAGAAAGARRALARLARAKSSSRSPSDSPRAGSPPGCSRTHSWCAFPSPRKPQPCSPDSPTSPTPGSAS